MPYSLYIFLPPGPAKNQIIIPAIGNIRTQRILSAFLMDLLAAFFLRRKWKIYLSWHAWRYIISKYGCKLYYMPEAHQNKLMLHY